MEALTRKSKRLSSFLSLNSSHDDDLPPPAMPPPAHKPVPAPKRDKSPLPKLSKLRKGSTDRVSSVSSAPSINFSYPSYSPPLNAQQPVQPPALAPSPGHNIPPLDTTELLPPPPVLGGPGPLASPANSRPSSRAESRPVTPVTGQNGASAEVLNGKMRKKNWLGGSKEGKDSGKPPSAWVAGHDENPHYDLDQLLTAQKVPELWDDNGDTFVYLFPRTSNKGPSFRVHSAHYSSSPMLTRLAHGRVYSQSIAPEQRTSEVRRRPVESSVRQLSLSSSSPLTQSPELRGVDSESSGSGSRQSRPFTDSEYSAPSEAHLYIPLALSTDNAVPGPGQAEPSLSTDDIEHIVAVRNFFAFLVGQSLVATDRRSSIFSIFLKISEHLVSWEFSNFDGSTYGEVANSSFEGYVEELSLGDLRASREKTIEAIVLGERMRSENLYKEGFSHFIGKIDEIKKLKSPKITLITPKTQNRMERASMDLMVRRKNVSTRLQDFDFPAIFSGIMNSKTSSERKHVRFEAWRSGFMSARKYIMGYYKHKYGSWPPKASSKKNTLETSGLNRLVLRDLYDDMSTLYDVLVDRANLTTRTVDPSGDAGEEDTDEAIPRALRRVLSEYDRSSPPVQPPIPFDVPLLPTLATVRKEYGSGDVKRDVKLRAKKLKDDEIRTLLISTHNADSVNPRHPFLAAFFDHEAKMAHNKTIDELLDQRVGQWLFMYACLNALPMLVVDAPAVKWSEGVEYFLCQVPRSGAPWASDEGRSVQRNWYGIAGSSGVVSLPADIVEHGVEGIYRRSHAWAMAEKWSANTGLLDAAVQDMLDPTGGSNMAGLAPPPSIPAAASEPSLRPRSLRADSPSGRGKRESVMMLGLEALPVPAGVSPVGAPPSRPQSSHANKMTFDDILGGAPVQTAGKKKKK